MSASRRAPKPRYVFTSDRDRIALIAGSMCGFFVLVLSAAVQGHHLLEALFRALVAMVVTYATAYIVVWLVAYLRETQSIAADAVPDHENEEPEIE